MGWNGKRQQPGPLPPPEMVPGSCSGGSWECQWALLILTLDTPFPHTCSSGNAAPTVTSHPLVLPRVEGAQYGPVFPGGIKGLLAMGSA